MQLLAVSFDFKSVLVVVSCVLTTQQRVLTLIALQFSWQAVGLLLKEVFVV